jgi:hypothetical protein
MNIRTHRGSLHDRLYGICEARRAHPVGIETPAESAGDAKAAPDQPQPAGPGPEAPRADREPEAYQAEQQEDEFTLLDPIIDAVAAVHAAGLVHRDIKHREPH